MKKKLLGLTAILWFMNLSPAFCDEEVFFLDLTRVQPSTEFCQLLRVVGQVTSGVDPSKQKLPLELAVTPYGKENHQVDEQGLFDITIRNVSSKVQIFPVESDLLKIVPDGCKGNQTKLPKNYQYVNIVLRVEEKSNANRRNLFLRSLFGSEETQGSILHLKPGEWVRLRVQAKTYVPDSKNDDQSNDYSLYAEYYLLYMQEDQWDIRSPIRSPSIRLKLKK